MYVSWSEAQANRDDRRTGVPWKVQYGKIGGGSDSLTTDANGQYESKLFFQSGQTNTWKNWDLTPIFLLYFLKEVGDAKVGDQSGD